MGQERDAVWANSRKWGKGIHPKVNEILGFLYLGHSNWTICSLLSRFCSKIFPLFRSLYWGSLFLLPQREENWKLEKGIHPKVNGTQANQMPKCKSDNSTQCSQAVSHPSTNRGSLFLLPQREEAAGAGNWAVWADVVQIENGHLDT